MADQFPRSPTLLHDSEHDAHLFIGNARLATTVQRRKWDATARKNSCRDTHYATTV